ncbi:hypothetical protein ANCDUO_18440 [Ancylostoma duodenale]|uniref:NTR domain-containing protein n=1 Tax=Ancylostoma duodenale TaxID=51022 RepID=A0A0C2FXV4_9BILA|nr:hypothetical protein ANCDUO_18440 [Ancylostoma duodenale]
MPLQYCAQWKMWSLIVLLGMVHITSSQNCYCPRAADSDFVIRAEVLKNTTAVNNSTYSTMYTISIVEIYKLENGTNISNAVYTYGDGPCATKLEQNRQYILKGIQEDGKPIVEGCVFPKLCF